MDTLETDRRISTGTAESPEGGVSKPGQREKLEKLTQVLGFRIQESDLGQTAASSKRQLTANEKKLFTKKAEKLSAMLGTTIPLESIVRFKPIEDLGLKEDEEVVDEERLDASDEESSSKEKRARYKKLAKVLGDGRSEGISAKVTGNPQRSGTNKQPGI